MTVTAHQHEAARSRFKTLGLSRVALAALCVLSVGSATPAAADYYYGVPVINMQTFGGEPGSEFNLMRVQASGELIQGLHLPDGLRICEFMFLGRDNDGARNARAQLLRKQFTRTSDPFAAPKVLASVRTRGANEFFREFSTTEILNPVIDSERFLYAVKLILPAGNSIEGVRIGVEIGGTCP